MKRIAGIGLILFAIATPAALAVIFEGEYQGGIKGDQSSSFGFDKDKDKVKDMVGSGLAYTCKNGDSDQTSAFTVDKNFKVDDQGRFGGKAPFTIQGFDPRADVTGKLKKGGTAKGTIRLRGVLDPTNRPGVKCDTGVQSWGAEKVPQP